MRESKVSDLAAEIVNGDHLSFPGAAKIFPPGRGGRAVHSSCVFRWHTTGIKTTTGIVKLEALKLGSRWLTSKAAVRRFLDALQRAGQEAPPERTEKERSAADRDADRQLAILGI